MDSWTVRLPSWKVSWKVCCRDLRFYREINAAKMLMEEILVVSPSIYGVEKTSQVVANWISEPSTVGVKDQQYKRIPKEKIKP